MKESHQQASDSVAYSCHTNMSLRFSVPAAFFRRVSGVEMTCSVIQSHSGSQRSQNALVMLLTACSVAGFDDVFKISDFDSCDASLDYPSNNNSVNMIFT